jgi:predicted transposase YbfD/YdcC
MYGIASSRVLSPLKEEERERLLNQAHLHSLVEMLEAIPDPRGKHGLRYDLPFLLTCLIAALLCNGNSSEAVSQWCREHEQVLRELFGSRLFLTPSGSLSRWLLPQIDVQSVEQVLSTWIRATSQTSATDPLAVDGKTVRGARTAEGEAPHLLSCFTHHSHEVWAEVAVGEKTNEIPEARKLLPSLPIRGRVCTFDALHSHRQLWNLLRSKHAYPLFVIKGNEPTLQADLTTYFADPYAQVQQAETTDRRRGRIEHRLIKVSQELCSYLQAEWSGISHVAQLTRTRTEKGETSVEVVYLIAILPPGHDGPQDLLALVRGHWAIENNLHYVRDVTFAEDRSRIRTGHAPGASGGLSQLGSYPHSSLWVFSDGCFSSLLLLSSPESFRPLAFQSLSPAIIHRPWHTYYLVLTF